MKTSIKLNDIYNIFIGNLNFFIIALLFSFSALILKVLRWRIVIGIFFSSNWNFMFLLNLSSISLLLSLVGLSLFLTDGIKSGVLAFREEGMKNKMFMFLTPYFDRFIGTVAAVLLAFLFFFKNYFILLFFFIIFTFLVIFGWNRDNYRIVCISLILSFISHIFDSFSLYLFLNFSLGYKISFYDWFLAFVLGSFSSLLSIFGGLGGRAIGMNLILGDQNLKISFILDIIYYLLQLFSAILGILLFSLNKFMKK
ncbi:MAG: hypothetical protein RMJ67_09645 [Elusimicrobiota bacterium]|nr:hypothetical protein [Endomicrobiia bacterium]MDW8166758.1 hypothetical protein [Elusimicrobiota bacterium]